MPTVTINTPREVTHERIADALEDIVDKIVDTSSASNIDYDNTESGLNANKVQSAIDELALAGFVTNTVNNLVNYYLKSETYNKAEVDSLINAVKNSRFEAVSTLPTTNIKTNVIYLVPKSPTQTSNAKDEYINLDGTSSGWEKIGDTEVDLSGYVTTTALNTALSNYTTTANLTNLLNNKVDKVTGKGLSTNDYTDEEKNKLSGIEAGAQVNSVTGVKGDSETSYRTGNINITKDSIGLGNVDNTSDANKPISTATQNALNLKANTSDIATSKTATGSLITLTDASNTNLIECVAEIKAQQSGSGDPSPSNVRPITGHDEVTTYVRGFNYFNKNTATIGKQVNNTGDLVYSSNRSVSDYIAVLPNTTYYFKNVIGSSSYFTTACYDGNKDFLSTIDIIGNEQVSGTITFGDNVRYIRVNFAKASIDNVCINLSKPTGSPKNGDYVPYNPNSAIYTIQLGDTIYGGELDVLTGKMRVTHGEIANYNGETLSSTWISDRDVYASGITPTTGAQVVYKLATPYTIKLSPTQIKLLKSTNNISCNTGDLSIKYQPDNVLGTLKADIESEYDARFERLEQYTDVFGFIEDMDVLSPTERIKYIGKNENYEPLFVDLSTGRFTLGDWGDFPVLTDNKPYMVKPDGTPDYQLNEWDYSKKIDGTDSDITDISYDGGAFSWIRKIYKKSYMVGNRRYVLFSLDKKDGFSADGFINQNGVELTGRWLPMYYGTVVNGVARSIATGNCITGGGLTTDAQHNAITAFHANAKFLGGSFVETLIDLLMMFAKTSDLQAAYGYGNSSGYVNDSSKNYGMLDNAVVGGGQFYGTSGGKTINKIFHSMVLGTYNSWMRDPYEVIKNGEVTVSKDYTYDPTGATYTDTGIAVPNQSSSAWRYTPKYIAVPGYGSIPDISVTGASTALGRADGAYTLANQSGSVTVCRRFGDCGTGLVAGVSARSWYNTASDSWWIIGFALLLDGSAVA